MHQHVLRLVVANSFHIVLWIYFANCGQEKDGSGAVGSSAAVGWKPCGMYSTRTFLS
jgi:hypothetical protein